MTPFIAANTSADTPASNLAAAGLAPTQTLFSKVPQITLSFWVIKILCTTVGETGADFLVFDAGLGLRVTLVGMATLLLLALAMQLHTRRCTPWIYWLTVVLVSIVGTQITDLLIDGLGVPLTVSTPAMAVLLAALFALWYRVEKTLAIHSIYTRRRELFYWAAIVGTFALGTAAGDLASETLGLGYAGTALGIGALIALTCAAWRNGANAVLTFWVGYILTRPFGAALGDWLTQAKSAGGLGMGTVWTSALFLSVIVLLVGFAQWSMAPQPTAQLH